MGCGVAAWVGVAPGWPRGGPGVVARGVAGPRGAPAQGWPAAAGWRRRLLRMPPRARQLPFWKPRPTFWKPLHPPRHACSRVEIPCVLRSPRLLRSAAAREHDPRFHDDSARNAQNRPSRPASGAPLPRAALPQAPRACDSLRRPSLPRGSRQQVAGLGPAPRQARPGPSHPDRPDHTVIALNVIFLRAWCIGCLFSTGRRLAEVADDDLDEEDILLARMDGGLYTVQQVGALP